MTLIIILILYAGIFYYLLVVRKKKERKKVDELMASLHEGASIRTISGICGIVVAVREKDLIVDISAESDKIIRVRIHKGAVSTVN